LGPNLSGVGVYSRAILFGLARRIRKPTTLSAIVPIVFVNPFLKRSRETAAARSCGPVGRVQPACFTGLNQRIDSSRYRRTVATFHDLFVMTGDYSTPEFRRRFTEQARTRPSVPI